MRSILTWKNIIFITYLSCLGVIRADQYANKICSLFKQSDCNDILDSDAAKLCGVIGRSEIGLGYFITNTFIITCLPIYLPYLAIINSIALSYSLWCIWNQKFKTKQWCPLYLDMQLLLWLTFLVNLIFGELKIVNLDIADLFIYLIPMLFINMLIPSLGYNKKEERAIPELNILKAYEYILAMFLSKQPQYVVNENSSKILFGNSEANVLVTILTNPHCEPYTHMHTRIEKLLSENKNICVQYIMSYFSSPGLETSNKFLFETDFNNVEQERMTIYSTGSKERKYKKDTRGAFRKIKKEVAHYQQNDYI